MPEETPRQRFIRNGSENARICRLRQLQCEQKHDYETARQIGEIQDRWDEILAEAIRQETENPGT